MAITLAAAAPAAAQRIEGSAEQSAAGQAVEAEVRDNILHQPLGLHTVEALHLPPEFVRRVADRIIRSSFEQRHRIIVQDQPPVPIPMNIDSAPAAPSSPAWRLWALGSITVVAGLTTLILMWRSRKGGD